MLERSTIYEVARRSGVSTATVSRVMHDGSGFSATTRERVRKVALDLGWVPNGAARGLARRRVGIIGLLFPDLADDDVDSEAPLFVDLVIRGAERAANLAGDAVLIAATRCSSRADIARSVASKVDGLIVTAQSLSHHEVSMLARMVPVVVIAARTAQHTHDMVCADNRQGSRSITEHLLVEHGYRDIAFVAGPPESPDSIERFAGFRDALGAAGLRAPKRPAAHGEFTQATGKRLMGELLEAGQAPPRAVIFANDQMAIGGLQALRTHGCTVPGDVAVVGFDDITSSRHTRPTLTTVAQPMRKIGAEAVRVLLDRLDQPGLPHQVLVLPTQLIVRRSCGCSKTSDSAHLSEAGEPR